MLTTAIGSVLTALIKILPGDVVKKGIMALIDKVEHEVKDSENKIDDAIVLPLISFLRNQLGIKDGDENDQPTD